MKPRGVSTGSSEKVKEKECSAEPTPSPILKCGLYGGSFPYPNEGSDSDFFEQPKALFEVMQRENQSENLISITFFLFC